MATPTLVATAGSASANSYSTVAEGNIFHDKRLNATSWTSATTLNKTIALIYATRLLDERYTWVGIQAATTQALAWPRNVVYDEAGNVVDYTAIPQFLKDATAELAMWLLKSDRQAEDGMKGIKYINVEPIKIVADKSDRIKTIPSSVYSIIQFYCVSKRSRRLTLVRG